MEEKKFLKPQAEIVNFINDDIITESNGVLDTISPDDIPWYS